VVTLRGDVIGKPPLRWEGRPQDPVHGRNHDCRADLRGRRARRLDPVTRAYAHAGMHRDRIEVAKPYPVDIDLTAIDNL
jgi:hypothetical protein